jgi:hypothetical protein
MTVHYEPPEFFDVNDVSSDFQILLNREKAAENQHFPVTVQIKACKA